MPAGGARLTLDHFGKAMTVSISGTVIDDIGRTLPKVPVSLLTGEVVVANSISDKSGEFGFSSQSVKVGFYAIRAAMPNYDPAEEKLTLLWEMDKMSFELVLRLVPRDEPKIEVGRQEELRREATAIATLYTQYSGTQPTESAAGAIVPPAIPDDKAKHIHIRVLFATDRNRQPFEDPKKRFGNDWAANERISFGACDVQLPYERKVGDLPRPSLFRLQFREDPNEHIVLKSCEDLDTTHFYREVSERGPSVLFFVHGYCVTFAEAIYRTAQIVDDIGFGGAPICYSWPSKGQFWAYKADEDSVYWTRLHLLDVLRETTKLTGIQTINIIAHSMGNRAVIECMAALAREFSGTRNVHQVNQVVFAAPDVNAGIFRQHLDTIKGAAKRFTLYASSHDKPLKWSRWFSSFDRAGQGGSKLVIHPVLDSVDASAVPYGVLDHSYYGSTWTVLGDIHELFRYNSAPPRFAIKGPKNDGPGDYWEIRS